MGTVVAAKETTLRELLEGSRQYLVPLYQRTYSWDQAQLTRLWSDICSLAEDRTAESSATHFMGSLVLGPSPTNGAVGVQQYLVVDGQQRLTTLTLLLCALRDRAKSAGDAQAWDRINESYLTNKFKPEHERLKLVPTQANVAAYQACVDATPHAGGADGVGAAYRYFAAQFAASPDLDLAQLEDAVLSGLSVVSVTAQPTDNVHRIFESLNNTGLKLSQADLLRNYLFMRMPTRAEVVHSGVWMPLQQSLSSAELETLFWIDLVFRDSKIKQTDTYARQQARLDRMTTENEIESEVIRLAKLGALYRLVLHPSEETDPGVAKRLRRLQQWGSKTVNPVLLQLLHLRATDETGNADSATVARAMHYLESYLVRRMLIGRPTNGLNRTMTELAGELSADKPVDLVTRRYLSVGRKYFGSDAAVRSAARHQALYLNGRPAQRRQLLNWLEESFQSKEPVDLSSLSIEHVMPQTLTGPWEKQLGSEVEEGETVAELHHSLLHTLGNLTLTGFNSTLSNSPYSIKRTKLIESGVSLSKSITPNDKWGRREILARADDLAGRIIATWPGPEEKAADTVDEPWELLAAALAELPAGSWTNYGELAVVIGSGSRAVGARMAEVPVPNAHRVLQVDGSVAEGFSWLEEGRTDDPRQMLASEGVTFDERGRADPAQRLTAEQLSELIGKGDPNDTAEVGVTSAEQA